MKENLKKLVGKEITLIDLSNELVELGYGDFFDQIGNLEEIIDLGSVTVDEELNIWFTVVELNEELSSTIIKITSFDEV